MSSRKKEAKDEARLGYSKSKGKLAPSSSKNLRLPAEKPKLEEPKREPSRHRSSRSLASHPGSGDSSLDRRSSSRVSTREQKDTFRKGDDKKSRFGRDSSKRLRDDSLNMRASQKSIGASSRGDRDGRRSPDFGRTDSEGRLETFGRRDQGKRTGVARPKPSDLSVGLPMSEAGRDRPRTHFDDKLGRDDRGRGDGRDRYGPRSSKNKDKPPTGFRSREADRRREGDRRRDLSKGKGSVRGRPLASEKGSRVSRGATSTYDDPRFEKHISSKMSKRSSKRQDFTEDKKKRAKDWMLDFKAHRSVAHLKELLEQPNKDTMSYLIKLSGVNRIPVESIPLLKVPKVAPTLTYSCTLYDQTTREFLGRTYTSRPIQLTAPHYSKTEENSKDFIFMHTATKTENL